MGNTVMRAFSSQEFGQVRTITHNGEPWFVAVDVCRALDVKNITQAIQRLEADERAMLNIGRQGDTNIVSECGLYALIGTSRKPEARAFQRWINHEVLPSIRKIGVYVAPDKNRDADVVNVLITALRNEQDLSAALQRRINWLTSPEGAEMRKHGRLRADVKELPQKATDLFLRAMAETLAEDGRIENLYGYGQCADPARMIGYEDECNYYLIPSRAYHTAEQWCLTHGEPLPVGCQTLNRCLREMGVIQPSCDGKTNTRCKLIYGHTKRLLWVCKMSMQQARTEIAKEQ